MPITLKTERLILRPWKEEDLVPFAKLNADSCVREFFPKLLSKEESDQSAKRFQEIIEANGWGFWAVSAPGIADFIGFIGLNQLVPETFAAQFSPAVEIGWRLSLEYWGKGYASEGARACLDYAFNTLQLDEVVAFTAMNNMRSRNVMEKIGMQRNIEDDFNHPNLPEGHPLQRHVLYRIGRETFVDG